MIVRLVVDSGVMLHILLVWVLMYVSWHGTLQYSILLSLPVPSNNICTVNHVQCTVELSRFPYAPPHSGTCDM